MSRRLALVAVLGIAAAGCTPGGSDGAPAAASDPGTESPGAASASPPPSFAQRSALPSCGVDEPGEAGYPNQAARECFQAAYDSDEPTEFTRVSYGDEGESIRAHFRVLGDGRYEIVGQWFASPLVEEEFRAGKWVRYECDRFVFDTRLGAETFGLPARNAAGECVLVEQVPA